MELYIHIPFCIKKCNYCDFLSGVFDEGTKERYTEKVIQEIRHFGHKFRKERLETVYFGGGTPTSMEPAQIGRIMAAVTETFAVIEDTEVTIECNPGTATRDAMFQYREYGFDRISLGLQSAIDEELRMLGRAHDSARFVTTFQAARSVGFANINVDIMTGLPLQTLEKLAYTVDFVTELRPEHISAYALSIEKGTPFYETYCFDAVRQAAGYETHELPNEESLLRMTDYLEQTLYDRGYLQYEISNFAREGCESRHNTGYWRRVPYLGVGLGAASLLLADSFVNQSSHVKKTEIRTANVRDMETYLTTDFSGAESAVTISAGEDSYEIYLNSPAWESVQPLTREDAIKEFMFLGLRMTEGVSRQVFEKNFGQRIDKVYGGVLHEMEIKRLIKVDRERVYLTKQGQRLANYVMGQFL